MASPSFVLSRSPAGRYYKFIGQGSISELVCGGVLPKGWWPQRDSNPCFRIESPMS